MKRKIDGDIEGFPDEWFLEKPNEDYRCTICLMILRNAVETVPCGHLYCETCIQKWIDNKKQTCPKCRSTIDRTQGINFLRKQIGRLMVFCPQKGSGCNERFRLEERMSPNFSSEQHLCPFQLIACGFCQGLVVRQELKEHEQVYCPQRLAKCDLCSQSGRGSWISTHECPMQKIWCENKCGFQLLRKDLAEHKTYCTEETVECCFAAMGCTARFKRKERKEHERSLPLHLLPLFAKYQNLEQEVKSLRKTNRRLERLVTGSRFGATVHAKNLTKGDSATSDLIESPNQTWVVQVTKLTETKVIIFLDPSGEGENIFPVTVRGWVYVVNWHTKQILSPIKEHKESLGPIKHTFRNLEDMSPVGKIFTKEFLVIHYGVSIDDCSLRLEWEIV